MEERVSKRERLLSLVFPAHCVLCGKLTEGGRRLCPECSRNPAPESVYRKLGNRYESHCCAWRPVRMQGKLNSWCWG